MSLRINRQIVCVSLLACTATALHAQSGNQPPTLPNVPGEFARLERYGDWMGFYLGPAPDPTQSKHWQGIARHPNPLTNIFYLTRSGENLDGRHANLAVLKMDSRDNLTGDRIRSNRLLPNTETQDTAPPTSDAIIRNIEYTTHNHAGGVQVTGNILVVPLEDPNGVTNPTGKLLFYDISEPSNPVLLDATITSSHNFGVVGLTQLDDGRYLLLATYGNNSVIEFFLSEPNDLGSFTNTPYVTLNGNDITNWPVCNNAGGVYCFQNCNFLQQADGTLYLACTWNTSPAAPVINGIDAARLFRVDMAPNQVSLTYVSTRVFNCSANSTGSNGNFNAAAGFYVSPTGELLLYSTTHDNDGPNGSTSMSEFRNYRGTEASVPASPCDAWVRLYADANGWVSEDRGMTFDAVDRAQDNYNDFRQLDGGPIPAGFSDQASSAVYCLPVGTTARLWQNDSFGGKYLDLVGTGNTVFIPDFSNIGWTSGSGNPGDAITSIQFFNAPAPGLAVPRNAPSPSLAQLLIQGGPCAVIRIDAGSYAENPRLDRQIQFRAIGGPVTIGTNP